jgi:hypothetical protein
MRLGLFLFGVALVLLVGSVFVAVIYNALA